MSDFAWAIIGPGAIAHRFADAVHHLPGTRLHSVLGRDPARAIAFAAHWARDGVIPPMVAVDLASVLTDNAVDAIYIATPHSHHAEFASACLEAGKPVLCEKPLVPNLPAAERLVTQSREHGVFLMEALWTRFLPVYAIVGEWLREQAIGPLRAIQSSFCFNTGFNPDSRLFDPALAGGSLLDIGIYNLAMTRWVLERAQGVCPEPLSLLADGVLSPSGVDQRVAGTVIFADGVSAQFVCGFDGSAQNALHIYGERGYISLPQHFWEATEAVLVIAGQNAQTAHAPFRFNGFEGEVEEAMRCIRAGLIESPMMPHGESLALVGWIDELRRQVGVQYPFE